MPRQYVRAPEIRKPDTFNDQHSASEIANAESSSVNSEDFINFIISQIKRVIHGDGSGEWHDDPTVVFGNDASLRGLYVPQSVTLTRNGEGLIIKVELSGGRIIDITRDVDGIIQSLTDGTYVWTLNRDGNGVLTGVTVT